MAFVRYLLVGLVNTLVGLGVIYAAMYFFHQDLLHANALGYAVGIVVSFTLNKRWTFKSRDRVWSSFAIFLLVTAVAYAANVYAVLLFNRQWQVDAYWAQALGVIPYTLIGYLGSRFFAFRQQQVDAPTTHVFKTSCAHIQSRASGAVALSLVVPCYNEQEVLTETAARLNLLLKQLIDDGKISADSKVYFVDDGSRDLTWPLIETLFAQYAFVHGVKLSSNRGHQNALLAGLLTVGGEALISLDADLQDDLQAIGAMIDDYLRGYDIVYGVRSARHSDTFFKRFSAQAYYQLLNAMGVDVIYNHADYRLMSRAAIEALRQYTEVNVFLRGIIPLLGYPSSIVYYERAERFAGESKYPLSKMLAFAWQGITSFSELPLRFITGIGMIISMFSFMFSVWAIVIRLFTDKSVPGWASTVLPIYFLGGIQLLCIGIIGEYLAKIYSETKRRPRYNIEKII
jgi:polyisoprenyl-phosphate glycosyltransferase